MLKRIMFLLILPILGLVASCSMMKGMQEMKTPKYEIGKHLGAEYCGECHEEIFLQWKQRSRHAVATRIESFHAMKQKLKSNFAMNMMIGKNEEMCYSCHGAKEANEGVDCETCHGLADPTKDIDLVHKSKLKPALEALKKPEFCGQCHEVKNPMSGASLLSLYGEWKGSPASLEGKDCQSCHMKRQQDAVSYHGFDSARITPDIYKDDVEVSYQGMNFPRVRISIKNRITGHAIPAAGPTRIMSLEARFYDENGQELLLMNKTFSKKVTLMMGLMPLDIIENTQIQAGETRELEFVLPEDMKGRFFKMNLLLKFYEVPDEYLGDLEKANWVSEPFFRKDFVLKETGTF